MMVIVPRIAAVSYLDTIPFLYGIAHEADLCAELLLSDFAASVQNFIDHKADIALVPVHVVPRLLEARIVTEYCIAAPDADSIAQLAAAEPAADICRYFEGSKSPLGGLLAAKKPFAYAVWVARKGTDPDFIERLQYALTYGLEHTYEAIVEAGYADKPFDAYGYITRLDFVFDNQKHKALEKFWDLGLKVSPRANPG